MAEDSQHRLYGTVASVYRNYVHLFAGEVRVILLAFLPLRGLLSTPTRSGSAAARTLGELLSRLLSVDARFTVVVA